MNATAYTFKPARYAKNCIAVCVASDNGWKSRAGYVADDVKARYSRREDAYIMTQSQFRRFEKSFQDACSNYAKYLAGGA